MRKPKNHFVFSSSSNHMGMIPRWRILTSQVLMIALLLGGAGRVSHAQEDLLIDRHDDGYSLQWNSEDGTTSFIQHSTDLVNWQFTPHYHVGDASARSHVLSDDRGPAVNSLSFFRLLLHPTNPSDPDDTDGDGLKNTFELGNGYSPTTSDSDGNGTNDGDEDSDRDGLTNSQEAKLGTDPNNSDSDGDGTQDGNEDSDDDGLTNQEEIAIGTDPEVPDTDDDGIIDGQDGWPICKALAPERLPQPKYVVICIKEIDSSDILKQFDINNNARAILRVGNISHYYKADAAADPLIELPSSYLNSWGTTDYHTYKSLNEDNYFVQDARAIYHDGEIFSILEKPTPADLGLAGIAPNDFRNYEASVVFHDGAVVGSADVSLGYVGGSGTHLDAEADLLWDAKGDFTILNEALHSEQDEFVTGTFNGNNIYGFVTTYSNSPSFSINDPYWGGDPYVFPTTAVNAGSLMELENGNSQEVAVGYQYTISDDYWIAPADFSWLDYYWDGEITQDIGIWLKKENKFQVLHSPQCYNDYNTYAYPTYEQSVVHLSNKNTVMAAIEEQKEVTNPNGTKETITEHNTYIWLDQNAGLQNDEEVNSTPKFMTEGEGEEQQIVPLIWNQDMGPTPPTNLNAQMQGFEADGSKIWHNSLWLDLADIIPETEWTGIQLKDINDHGMLAAQATNKEGKKCAVLLLPVDIVPDYNRDGKIDQADRGKVTKDNPWRWWVNDDKDDGDYAADEESDVPGQADGNFSDGAINGVTDLTDFFPIFLDIKQALEVLSPGEYDYKLSQDDGALNFAEAPDLIPDDDPDYDGAGAYWRSAFWAENYKNLPVQHITASGVSLSHSFLDQLKDGRGILLLEYRKASEAPLELEIWKGSQKLTTIAFHAKVDKVEEMYRHLNLYEATGTQSSQLNDTGEPDNYPDDKTNEKAFVMIHGYAPRGHGAKNDRIQRGFQSEIFRRLHQAGSKAKFVAVYWDSATGLDYHKAVYQAFKTSPFVGPRLGFLAGNEITVGAHSLGNIVTSNAVCHEGFRPKNYFLINAASPIEAYNPTQTQVGNVLMKTAMTEREWKPYDERFHSPNWHARFPANDNRSKLKWKGRFSNIKTHTEPFNFYSTGEDVVANPESDNYNVFRTIWKKISEDQDLGRFAWVGQEFIKGGTSIAAGIAFERNHGGWAFNGRNQELRFMVEHNPLDPPGTYQIPLPNTANQRLNNGIIVEDHLAQFGLFKRFESPAYEALYAPINDANKNWTDAAGFAWQNPHTKDQGSALAGQKDTQWVILATAMPSVSFAAAANDVGNINGFNMNGQKNGWPNLPHRNQFANDWQHGDFVGIGASYVKNMYKKAVEKGGLDD